ncbi:hypothetical protein [Faecalibaculum rodentium]|uniref:hypothetical protein n=1 Tax=Faecalibaculum rodentium TaxID=1702221 RepID=UPI0023EF77E2|nr:hypothetical protein [Faecalibaculum rodentium]
MMESGNQNEVTITAYEKNGRWLIKTCELTCGCAMQVAGCLYSNAVESLPKAAATEYVEGLYKVGKAAIEQKEDSTN